MVYMRFGFFIGMHAPTADHRKGSPNQNCRPHWLLVASVCYHFPRGFLDVISAPGTPWVPIGGGGGVWSADDHALQRRAQPRHHTMCQSKARSVLHKKKKKNEGWHMGCLDCRDDALFYLGKMTPPNVK